MEKFYAEFCYLCKHNGMTWSVVKIKTWKCSSWSMFGRVNRSHLRRHGIHQQAVSRSKGVFKECWLRIRAETRLPESKWCTNQWIWISITVTGKNNHCLRESCVVLFSGLGVLKIRLPCILPSHKSGLVTQRLTYVSFRLQELPNVTKHAFVVWIDKLDFTICICGQEKRSNMYRLNRQKM